MIAYSPSPWQTSFHDAPHNELLGAGAAGPGKTTALKYDPFQQVRIDHARCERNPSLITDDENSTIWRLIEENPLHWGDSVGHALYLRRDRTMLEQVLSRAKKEFPSIDPGVVFNSERNTFIFSSGYNYQFDHCYNRTDYQRYDSNEYTHIGFDELIQFLQEQYERIKIRVRTTDPVLKHFLKVRACSNPHTGHGTESTYVIDNPNWVRDYFVEPAPEGGVTLATNITLEDGTVERWTRIYLPARLRDNPDPEFRRQYEITLRKSPPHIRRAMLEGNWDGNANAFFAECWDRARHIVAPFSVPSHWGIFRSCDWGFVSPGCIHWYAQDPDTLDLYVVAEHTFQRRHPGQVGCDIVDKEEGFGFAHLGASVITGPADTQMWEERGDGDGDTLRKVDEFDRVGVSWEQANKRSRRRNAELVAQMLMGVNDRGGEGPMLKIFSTCYRLARTLPLIPTDPTDPTVPKKGGDDHWYDSLSYGVNYASTRRIPSVEAVKKALSRPARSSRRSRPSGDRTGYGTPV